MFIYVAYQPGAENQTASSLAGISSMETLLPALFHLLLAFTIRACKLNNPMMAHCQRPAGTRVTSSLKESVMSVMEVDLHKLKINDPFLGQYQQLVRDVVIPYQWDALNDRIAEADPSHAIENFRIAAGQQEGEFYGMVFQDSDVAKWLEAVAWSLASQKPDAELEKPLTR